MGRNNADFHEGKDTTRNMGQTSGDKKTTNDKIADEWGYEGGDQNEW